MDRVKLALRQAARVTGTRHDHGFLPTSTRKAGHSVADRDDTKEDGERLLGSPRQEESETGSLGSTVCDGDERAWSRSRSSTCARINLVASLFWVLGVLLLAVLASKGHDHGRVPVGGTFGWSPAVDDDAVEYVEYTFPYYDVDPGQELWNNKPTYEQDVRWYESYNWLSRVPTKDAENMPNGTVKIPGDEEHSLVWLGVFHELHCLNVLRKLVWFEYYSVHSDLVAGRNSMRNHLIHCIDALRKGVMCHADVTPVPFWSEPWLKGGEITPVFKIPHTCRSYDRVLDWAKEHRIEPGSFECEDEVACGALAAITMTVPPGDPQPTHWPDPDPQPAPPLSEEEKEVLQCDKSVLDWCE